MQGEQWNWSLRRHRELDTELLAVLSALHARGICHGDIHKGNITVAADNRIVILDFDQADLDASATDKDAEYEYLSNVLAMPVRIAHLASCPQTASFVHTGME